MQSSLRALLTGIIDYAGLFPPARLPLDQALGNYLRYRQDNESWMLGRFIIPAARLGELRPFRSSPLASGPPLPIAALGRGGNSVEEFLENLTLDMEAIASCRAEHGDRVRIGVFETRLPGGSQAVDLIGETTQQAEQLELFPFFEIGLGGDWQTTVAGTAQACAAVSLMAGTGSRAGLKLRCGGLEASAFPSVEQVAEVLAECVVTRVPLKFTAGLHHPLRRHDKSLKVHTHGFLNVFVAGVLTTEHRLAEPTLREILLEEKPKVFRWDADAIGWREWTVRTAEVELARQYSMTSFGSCSFDEPRTDLRALGWL